MRGGAVKKDYSELFDLSGASIRLPKGTDSTNYRGWIVEKYEGVQLVYRTSVGPGKGRKIGGYLLTKSEDGAKKIVGNLKEAKEYIDEYEGM